MSVRTCRWLSFLVLALALPLPMVWVPFDACVPAVGYAILFCASAAVALAEGTAGPVPGILLLAGSHALAAAGLAGLAAWIAGRALAPAAPRTRRWIVLGACAALLGVALGFEIYRTPFWRAPVGNLLDVLS